MKLLHDAPLPPESLEKIRRLMPEITVISASSSTLAESLADANVLYTELADFDPAAAPNLKWVQINAAGTDGVSGRPVLKSPIPVCSAVGSYSVAVAECTFAMLLALTRKVTMACDTQRAHNWPTDYDPWLAVDLHGLTLGILGYGSIGRQVARLGQAFGMQVLACKRRPDERRDDAYLIPGTGDPDGLIPSVWFGTDELGDMLLRSDVVVITLPAVPTTIGMIGPHELALMKPTAYLINVGRGAVLDERALVDVLRARRIAGAGLDVVVQEPMPPNNPLWDMPNALILPHIGAWTAPQAHRSAEVLIENLRRHLAGEPLVNVIDKTLLY